MAQDGAQLGSGVSGCYTCRFGLPARWVEEVRRGLIAAGRTMVDTWLTRDQFAAAIAWQRWRQAGP